MTAPTTTTDLIAEPAGDVAAALDAAQPSAQVIDQTAAPQRLLVVATRPSVVTAELDLERYLPAPARVRGTVRVFTADGFVTAFRQRLDPALPAAIYADPDTCHLTAVLNDDDGDINGWRDHRLALDLKHTPEWMHWTEGQGLHPQAAFAEIIEAGQDEIVGTPGPTEMLEIAQQFTASVGGRFRQQSRLKDGTVQLVWEETVDAKVGEGLVDVPSQFTVSLRPFYGAEPREVTARIRYTCRGGELRIGYVLHRPDEVKRTAFADDVVLNVAGELPDHPLIEGKPAEPR